MRRMRESSWKKGGCGEEGVVLWRGDISCMKPFWTTWRDGIRLIGRVLSWAERNPLIDEARTAWRVKPRRKTGRLVGSHLREKIARVVGKGRKARVIRIEACFYHLSFSFQNRAISKPSIACY